MSDLIDYVEWRGDLDFNAAPFNAIDALILTQLSYLNFSSLLSASFSERKTLSALSIDFKNSSDYETRCDLGALLNPLTVSLLLKCGESERFKNIPVCAYREIYDEKTEEQFSALTFIFHKFNFVAYRGTDDTLIGWKEDFNLGYLEETPCQNDSVLYLSEAMEKLKEDFIISGHSKGGNSALYAPVKISEKFQKRIKSIYNFDGPWLSKSIQESKSFSNIADKIFSVYPENSVVGMIFFNENEEENHKFMIVKSVESGIMQHDALSWCVKGASFETVSEFVEESKFFRATFNNWIMNLQKSQIRKVVDTMFDVILASGAKTNSEIEKSKIQCSARILHAFAHLDSNSKKDIQDVVNEFMKAAKGNIPMFTAFKFMDIA